MSDTKWKGIDMPRRIRKADATPRLLCAPSPLMAAPWKAGMQAADAVPCARRVLCVQQTGGAAAFLVGSDPPADPPNYPQAGVWRKVHRTRTSLAPGCALELRVIAVRSGMTVQSYDEGATWQGYGKNGRVRLGVDFANLDSETDSATAEVALEPSPNDDGAEPTAAGGSWAHLIFKYVKLVAPADVVAGDPAALARWSEDTTVTMTIDHQGGARVIQCAVQEFPHKYVVHHDRTDTSIHAWPNDTNPTSRPQTKAPDGASFQELRFGLQKAMDVAAKQGRELGPMLASWGSYVEDLAEVADTDPNPVQVTSTNWVGLAVGSSFTAWSTDAPGFAIAGAYARRRPENSPMRLSGAAVVPVRIRVHARFSGAGSNKGYVRFQTSSRSWVDVEVDQAIVGDTWTDLTITGFLESMTAPDDPWPNLMDFARTTGGTLEVRYWSVEWGHKSQAG